MITLVILTAITIAIIKVIKRKFHHFPIKIEENDTQKLLLIKYKWLTNNKLISKILLQIHV